MFYIDIYEKNTKNTEFFQRNGDATLEKCISCIVKERLNGEYELEVVYPLKDKKSHYFKKWNVIKADGQLFRIYNIKNDYINNTISVSARHIFYDLDNYFTVDSRAVECNVKNAMIRALETNELNSIYKVDSDIQLTNTLYFVEQSPLTSMFEIISRWGVGELIRDNFNITIRNDVTYTEEYEIRYKKNILGLVAEENIDNIVTKIYPVGYNGITLPEKYLYVPKTNFNQETLPPYDVVKKVKFEGATDQSTLRIEGTRYVEKISVPFTNIKCDMVEIYNTPKYQSRFKNIKKIKPGDVCKVIHDEYNLEVFMKCVYTERDLINAENNKVELGELRNVLDKTPDFSDVYSKIEQAKPSIYFYQNNDTVICNSEYKNLFYEGINVSSSTHLKLYISLNGISDVENNVLDIGIFLNNQPIDLNPKQVLKKGENLVAVTITIPSLQSGEAYWLGVKVKSLNGTFTLNKNNAQIFAEGTGLNGGTGSEKPHIEHIETLNIFKLDNCVVTEKVDVGTQKPIKSNPLGEVIDINIKSNNFTESFDITLTRTLDDFSFNEKSLEMFEHNPNIVKSKTENQVDFIEIISEVETKMISQLFEGKYLYSANMPKKSDFKDIEGEQVYE